MMKTQDYYRGKWKVVELTNNTIKANGLTYEEAVREVNRLSRLDPCDVGGCEPRYQYYVFPSRKRKY